MNGPSREALEQYYLNNRPYFDLLAEKYKNEDPEYYNEYIAHFYENPLHKSKSKLSGCLIGHLTMHFIKIVIAVTISGIISFVGLFYTKNKPDDRFGKIIDAVPDSLKTHINVPVKIDNSLNLDELTHYQKGMIYFSAEEYELAEFHFSLIKEDDPAFKESAIKLNEIKKRKEQKSGIKQKLEIKDLKEKSK